MPAYPQDIYIEQGATFSWGFTLHEPILDGEGNPVLDDGGNPTYGDPLSLSGVDHARMQIRPKKNSDEVWVHATSRSIDDDADGGQRIFLESGGQVGRVDIVLTDLDTSQVLKALGFYDLELEYELQSGELRPYVQRVLEGQVTSSPNVTRGETATDT